MTTNRGILVILSIFIVISLVVLVGLLNSSSNLDNDRLTAKRYSGTLTIATQPLYSVNILFDGFGNINGTINYSNDKFSFEGDYACIGSEVQFAFDINNYSTRFIFIGNLQADDTTISGEVSKYVSSDEYYDGTFFLSLMT